MHEGIFTTEGTEERKKERKSKNDGKSLRKEMVG
jgi:hypothetical protein